FSLGNLVGRLRGHGRKVDRLVPRRDAIELRVPASQFAAARLHIEDFRRGEEVGFLICSIAHRPGVVTLLAREWHPVPSEQIRRHDDGYVSSWSAEFNSQMLERALASGGTFVVLHSHGHDPHPILSGPD